MNHNSFLPLPVQGGTSDQTPTVVSADESNLEKELAPSDDASKRSVVYKHSFSRTAFIRRNETRG